MAGDLVQHLFWILEEGKTFDSFLRLVSDVSRSKEKWWTKCETTRFTKVKDSWNKSPMECSFNNIKNNAEALFGIWWESHFGVFSVFNSMSLTKHTKNNSTSTHQVYMTCAWWQFTSQHNHGQFECDVLRCLRLFPSPFSNFLD